MDSSSQCQHPVARKHAQASLGRYARRRLEAHLSGRTSGSDSFHRLRRGYTLHANNTTLVLKHYLPAHTDSDISVHFVEANVFHTGDTFWNRNYPFVDYSTGGSIDGQIRAAEENIAKVTDKTIVIPGHGAVGGKADLIVFRDVLADAREKVATMKKQGRSLVEVIAAKPTARTDEEWGNGFMTPALFLEWVYQGV